MNTSRWAERLFPSLDSTSVVVTTVLVCGALAGFLEFVTHLAVARLRPPLELHAFMDAVVIGLMTMGLVTVSVTAARARRQRMLEDIRTVSELNHHVRNALQVISQSRYLPEEQQTKAVLDSVDRIDETLRRLFPAHQRLRAGVPPELKVPQR